MSARTELDNYSPKPKFLRYLLGYFALFLCSTLTKIKIRGRHNIPKKGPFIVAANHFSYVDPPFVVAAMQRPMTFLAASDQVIDWYFKWAAWIYGFIPTNRTSFAPSTIKRAKTVLKNNNILAIFPEGTSTDRKLREAKRGIVYLSSIDNTPIVPIGIHGLKQVWPNWFRGIRPVVTMKIGKAFHPKLIDKKQMDRGSEIDLIGDTIMCRIAALLPEKTHGKFYKDPRIEGYKDENNI